MVEWVLATLIVTVPLVALLWLAMVWNLRLSERVFQEAMASIRQSSEETIARIQAERDSLDPPTLLLTLRLRPPVDLRSAIASAVRLAGELSQYERSLGGQGLTPASEQVPSEEPHTVRLVLTPVSAVGAGERLAKVAQAVTEAAKGADAGPSVAVVPLAGVGRTFDALSAAVVRDSDQEPGRVGA